MSIIIGAQTDSVENQGASGGPNTVTMQLSGVRKVYGGRAAVDGLDLAVHEGEFLTLLGPSGCGKTTLLSMLAGFVIPDEGTVFIGGEDMTRVPPHRRPVNTVFQDYALFPHMSLLENVTFGLRMEKVPRHKARAMALQALGDVGLDHRQAQRHPAELSGGQRQRVALARALVKRPRVLLLDEPFAALDLQLRKRMQLELRQLHHDTDTTFVFVTHDQDEAAVLSDRIVVLREGHIEQVGTAEEIYDRPATEFVASFIGESNVLEAVVQADGKLRIDALDQAVVVPASQSLPPSESAVSYAVRPERVRLFPAETTTANGSVAATMRVYEVIRVGVRVRVTLELPSGGTMIASRSASDSHIATGSQVVAMWSQEDGSALWT